MQVNNITPSTINNFSTVSKNNSPFNTKTLHKSVLTPEQLENLTKDQLMNLLLQMVQVNQELMKEKTNLKEENHYLKQELGKCQENLQEVLEPHIQNYTFKELLSKKENTKKITSKESIKKEPITNPKKITLKECLQKETKQQKNRRYFYKSKLKKKIIITPYTTREYLKKLIQIYSMSLKL